MKYTSNYRLKLPDDADTIDIGELNSNFTAIDSQMSATEREISGIQVTDILDVSYATGTMAFYHGTFNEFKSLLQKVETSWGAAEFRSRYGDISVYAGSTVSLYITLLVEGGKIYWNEYYNGESGGEIYIGEATFVQTPMGDTECSFDYINDDVLTQRLGVREAIIELAEQIRKLRK